MSGYAVWTRIAIGVLVLGSPLVFLWFLKDAARLLQGFGGPGGAVNGGETTGEEPRSPGRG